MLALRKPKIGERCDVGCLEPMGFPVSVHGPPLSGFRSGFPVNTVVHKRPLGDDSTFKPTQMRVFLRLLIHLDYSFLEEVATHFASGDENAQQSDDEIVLAALDGTADEKLTSFALRLVLSDHIGIPQESQPDLLTEAEQVFAPKKPKAVKAKAEGSNKPKPAAAKASAKKETTKKKAA